MWQSIPPMPQVGNACAVHTLPAQQPFGHEAALQTHAPPTQVVPVPHCGPLPHRQSPRIEQVSARLGSHGMHARPPVPHAIGPESRQFGPEQQPLGQLPALHLLHAPPAQVSVPQSWHGPPAAPHI